MSDNIYMRLNKLESKMQQVEDNINAFKKYFDEVKANFKPVKEISTKEKLINDVIKSFDFERVKKTMDALHWTWRYSEFTPTIKELKETAIEILEHAWENNTTCGTGGFEATAERENDFLELKFVVTDWSVSADDFCEKVK